MSSDIAILDKKMTSSTDDQAEDSDQQSLVEAKRALVDQKELSSSFRCGMFQQGARVRKGRSRAPNLAPSPSQLLHSIVL